MYNERYLTDNAVEEWKKDLSSIVRNEIVGEEVRVVCGELSHDIYEALRHDFINVIENNGIQFKIIAGPIVSVDSNSYSNPIIELANDGMLELWISPYRRMAHHRIFGHRYMYFEEYHPPLSSDRKGLRIKDLIAISKHRFDFDRVLTALNLPNQIRADYLLKATNEQIMELRDEYGDLYDFIDPEEIREESHAMKLAME